jgi:PAS domain S-box-containing protein
MNNPIEFSADAVSPVPSAQHENKAVEFAIDFGTLFQAIPTPYLVISPQLTIITANRAYLRLANRCAADLVGRNIFDAFPDNPGDPEANGVANLRASLERVLKSGSTDQMAVQRYDVADDAGRGAFQARYWKTVNSAVLDAEGAVSYILHSSEEVTSVYLAQERGLRDVLATLTETIRDLKTADEIGYAAAAILGEALATSRVGYGTIDHLKDTLEVVRDWCAPGVDTLAGVTDLRSYGSFIDDLKLDKFIAISNVDEDPRTSPAAMALRGRSAAAFVNVPVVEEGVLAAVLFVNDAQVRHWTAEELALIKEVAVRIRTAGERLRGGAALRQSEAKFRTITDAMPQMVWSTLPDGYHDYFNEQWYAFTGVPQHSTDGEGWNDIFHPDDQERAWAAWRASLASGQTYEIQYRLRHHSGNYRWVLGRALPVRAEDGHIVRWMGTCTDIDDQKRAEEELRQASQRKDEFLAMLAHELRNPLAPISSAAQLLLLDHADQQRVRKTGQVILRQVRHLTDLVDDLLDVSRVTRGLVQIDRVAVDLIDVLHNAVEQARPVIDSRQHQLTLTLPSAPVLVAGDKTRLVQVVVNLLNNAAKYTAPDGKILLSLESAANEARIKVADNGSGIAHGLLPYIFDLFIQAERTPDRVQGGLGLGLALVKRITSLHGGSVHALSAGLGQGSSFVVTLPVLDAAAADGGEGRGKATAPAQATSTAAQSSSLPRVMVVDDHVDGAQLLASLLGAKGYDVVVAEDGANGLRMAAGQAIDAFILDIGLPDMDGYELAKRLRSSKEGRGALLVAVTGYGKTQDRAQAMAAGFDHHLVKPIDIGALTSLLSAR